MILALLGAASGVLDVAMNAAGIEHQRQRDSTPILSRLHGGYSIGVLGGATGGAAATAAGIPLSTHFAVVAGALVLLLLVARAHLPGRSFALPPGSQGRAPDTRPWRTLSVSLAVVAIAGLLLEGMVTDWSALLVSRDLAAGPAAGASVVVAFSLAMFISRSAGDRTVTALGRSRYLPVAGVLAIVGTAIGLAVPVWWAAYLGMVIVGLVLGPVFPLVIAAAAERSPESAAAATAEVSAVGYFAYLGGPPLVGALAHRAGLPVTIALVGALCGAALVLAARAVGDGAVGEQRAPLRDTP